MRVFSGFDERVLPLSDFSELCQESRGGDWEVFSGFDERVLPLSDFSELCQESRGGDWESFQVLPKEDCHWARSQNSSKRAD